MMAAIAPRTVTPTKARNGQDAPFDCNGADSSGVIATGAFDNAGMIIAASASQKTVLSIAGRSTKVFELFVRLSNAKAMPHRRQVHV